MTTLGAHAKRITANLPEDLLDSACRTADLGITDTLILGLRLVQRSGAAKKAQALKGKLALDIDLEVSRERRRRR